MLVFCWLNSFQHAIKGRRGRGSGAHSPLLKLGRFVKEVQFSLVSIRYVT